MNDVKMDVRPFEIRKKSQPSARHYFAFVLPTDHIIYSRYLLVPLSFHQSTMCRALDIDVGPSIVCYVNK